MVMSYDATFKDVKGVVSKIFPPKGKQRGHTYSIKVNNAGDDIKKYLNDYLCINLSTFDTVAQFEEGAIISIDVLGVKKNGNYINAYALDQPMEEKQLDGEEISAEPVPAWVGQKDPEDADAEFDVRIEKLKKVVDVIKDLSPEFQQAFAKDVIKII